MKLIDIIAKKSSIPVCIAGAIVLSILAVGTGLGLNKFSKNPLRIFAKPQVGVEVVDLAKAIMLHDQGTLFIDARTSDSYNDGHIPGALDLDFYGTDESFTGFYKKYDRSTPVVVYCEGITGAQNEDTCETSHFLADRLVEKGYQYVLLFPQGWAFWEKSGQPVIQGTASTVAVKGRSIPFVNYIRDLIMLVLGIAAVALRKNRLSVTVGQLILGAVFIISGSTKIFEPDKLAIIIDAYRIMPKEFVTFAALSMPWVEVLGGLSLITGIIPASGALLVAGMNLFFIPALSYRAVALAHQLGMSLFAVNFDCGCGLGENFAWVLILRDIGFLLMGIVVLISLVKRPQRVHA